MKQRMTADKRMVDEVDEVDGHGQESGRSLYRALVVVTHSLTGRTYQAGEEVALGHLDAYTIGRLVELGVVEAVAGTARPGLPLEGVTGTEAARRLWELGVRSVGELAGVEPVAMAAALDAGVEQVTAWRDAAVAIGG